MSKNTNQEYLNPYIYMISKTYMKLIVWFSRFHGTILRISSGRLMHTLNGLDMMLLSTQGRRTGEFKHTPLLYIQNDGKYYCTASFGGNDRNPDWFLNLLANPNVKLLVNQNSVDAIACSISGNERSEIWNRLVKYYPNYANYQRRTSRTIPVVRFDPTPDGKHSQDS